MSNFKIGDSVFAVISLPSLEYRTKVVHGVIEYALTVGPHDFGLSGGYEVPTGQLARTAEEAEALAKKLSLEAYDYMISKAQERVLELKQKRLRFEG